MGTLTLTQFRDELTMQLSNRADSVMSEARLNRWINFGYNHTGLPGVYRHRQLLAVYEITLVADTIAYAIDVTTVGHQITAIRSIQYVEATSNAIVGTGSVPIRRTKLKHRSPQWLDKRAFQYGKPTHFVIDANDSDGGEQLLIGEIPTGDDVANIMRVRHWREPVLLSADSDTTVLPYYWDEVILIAARMKAERDLGYRELAQEIKQDFAEMVNDAAASNPYELEAEDDEFLAEVVTEPSMRVAGG